MRKFTIKKILGIELEALTDDGFHRISIVGDMKEASITVEGSDEIPKCKIDIHLECNEYSFKID